MKSLKLLIFLMELGNKFSLNIFRALSIFWVTYGHAYLIRFSAISNTADAISIIEKPGFVTLAPSAYFAVDVFFFLGGFLAAFLVLEKLVKMR